MGEVWTKISIEAPTDTEYYVIELLMKELFDDEEHWPVEMYDKARRVIEIKEVLATEDDAIGFAKLLDKVIREMLPNLEGKINNVDFVMDCSTQYYNSGMTCDYLLERSNDGITICETGGYYYVSAGECDSYEELMDYVNQLLFVDPRTLLSEEDYDPDDDYYFSDTDVSVNQNPKYGPKKPIWTHMKTGKVFSANEQIKAGLKAMGKPCDDEAASNLSIEDAYAAFFAGGDEQGMINLTDKIFVLTGFDSYKEEELIRFIEERGGVVKSSTVLKTDYLIYNGQLGLGTKKYNRAIELNQQGKDISILTEQEFLSMIGEDE